MTSQIYPLKNFFQNFANLFKPCREILRYSLEAGGPTHLPDASLCVFLKHGKLCAWERW